MRPPRPRLAYSTASSIERARRPLRARSDRASRAARRAQRAGTGSASGSRCARGRPRLRRAAAPPRRCASHRRDERQDLERVGLRHGAVELDARGRARRERGTPPLPVAASARDQSPVPALGWRGPATALPAGSGSILSRSRAASSTAPSARAISTRSSPERSREETAAARTAPQSLLRLAQSPSRNATVAELKRRYVSKHPVAARRSERCGQLANRGSILGDPGRSPRARRSSPIPKAPDCGEIRSARARRRSRRRWAAT